MERRGKSHLKTNKWNGERHRRRNHEAISLGK
jgi:hypothetical protein